MTLPNMRMFGMAGGRSPGLYAFINATFTPGGQTGTAGPDLTTARAGLTGTGVDAWKNNTSYFNTSSGVQLWTVPATKRYRIAAYGANGGKAGTQTPLGGSGALIQGDFDLIQGQIIRIVCGQPGLISTGQSGGGGGGSFVLKQTGSTLSDILIIAGGGGGANWSNIGNPGSATNAATGSNLAIDGFGGNNGSAAAGAGGGGWNSNGVDGQGGVGSGGKSPANGFTGGIAGTCAASNFGAGDVGGFGGGGGGEWCSSGAAGGGGGYTGGSGSSGSGVSGGGGGSYNNGANQINTQGSNAGPGFVTITSL